MRIPTGQKKILPEKKKIPVGIKSHRALPVGLLAPIDEVTTDVVCIANVKAPLYYVPALDMGVKIDTVGNVHGKNAMYYVITREKVACTCLFEYNDYMHFNNTVFSDRRENSNYSYLNYNPYLSIEDMQHIKEVLDVDRNIEVDEDAIEEAYDFLIDTVDVDVMQEMET